MGMGLSLGDHGCVWASAMAGNKALGTEAIRWGSGGKCWGINVSLKMREWETENQMRGREAESIA